MSGVLETRRRAFEMTEAGARRLEHAGIESGWLDAGVLLAEAARVTRAQILSDMIDLSAPVLARYLAMIARREARMPVAYIVGRKEFYSLEIKVNPSVLIPRPETETLVATALEVMAGREHSRVLDIGTGSGAIAVAMAVNAPTIEVVATEISSEALEVARENAAAHQVADRIRFREADVFETPGDEPALGRFDLIVSNPPYISDVSFAVLAPEVLREPHLALSGGRDGLDFYRRIGAGARTHLTDGGELIVEVGDGQAHQVVEIFEQGGLRRVALIDDLGGLPRVVRASIASDG